MNIYANDLSTIMRLRYKPTKPLRGLRELPLRLR